MPCSDCASSKGQRRAEVCGEVNAADTTNTAGRRRYFHKMKKKNDQVVFFEKALNRNTWLGLRKRFPVFFGAPHECVFFGVPPPFTRASTRRPPNQRPRAMSRCTICQEPLGHGQLTSDVTTRMQQQHTEAGDSGACTASAVAGLHGSTATVVLQLATRTATLASCLHSYCEGCLNSLLRFINQLGEEEARARMVCPNCRHPMFGMVRVDTRQCWVQCTATAAHPRGGSDDKRDARVDGGGVRVGGIHPDAWRITQTRSLEPPSRTQFFELKLRTPSDIAPEPEATPSVPSTCAKG